MNAHLIKSIIFTAVILGVQLTATAAPAQDYYYHHRWHHYHRYDYFDPGASSSNSDGSTQSDTGSSSDTSSSGTTGSDTGSTSGTTAGSSPTPTPSAGTPVGGGPPVSGMLPTFDDEFDTLDASSSGQGKLWETKFWYNSLTHSNWENLDLDPAVCGLGITPYSIKDGILDIHEETTDPRLKACGITNPYTSGNLNTYYSFSQQYGYFEVRAQASGLTGTTFAFWMLPKDGSWPPEIDITETNGRAPMIDNASNHTGTNNATMTFPVNDGVNLSAGFHTYGVLWTAESITYLLDGKPVAKTPAGADEHKPFFLILGLGVGSCGGWVGCPQNPSNFSADVYVDYVRAWQFAN